MSESSSKKFRELVRRTIATKKIVRIDKKMLAARNRLLYPWIERNIDVLVGKKDYELKTAMFMVSDRVYSDDNTKTAIEFIPFLMFCVRKLTENYISKNNPPTSDWQVIALAALMLSWKSYGLDEHIYTPLKLSQLSMMCGGACPEYKLRSLEQAILKLENYIICGAGGMSVGYHPPEGISLDIPFPDIPEPEELDETNLKLERELQAQDQGWMKRYEEENMRQIFEKSDSDDES